MPITIAGSGTITGISAGGLPDDSIIAADIAAGAVTTAKVADANITAAKLDGAQSGSAPIYAARAWCNWNGTGTVAIRASGNVSSITDVATGLYTVNFTTSMADANYAALLTFENPEGNTAPVGFLDSVRPQTTGGVTVCLHQAGVGNLDRARLAVSIFR